MRGRDFQPRCSSTRQDASSTWPSPASASLPFAAVALLVAASAAAAVSPATVAGTHPLAWPEADLSARMMDGAHAFVERTIAESPAKRAAHWARDFSSPEAYASSVEPNRERLRTILGAVDPRLPPELEKYGDDARPALVAETARYSVHQVRWPVLAGVWGCGLLVQPKSPPRAHVVLLPDADQSPEQVLGLAPGAPPALVHAVRRLAEHDVELIVPVMISRAKLATDDPQLRRSDQTHREWIYRQAFHLGRHVIGYEVQIARAAVDWFSRDRDRPRSPSGQAAEGGRSSGSTRIGIAGYGEGGLVAFHAAAIDPRIDAALVSGYFDSRERAWAEPIYRNVWSRLREFGDAEIASLVLPRALVIEHSPPPVVTGHKGEVPSADFTRVQAEVHRVPAGGNVAPPVLIHAAGRPVAPFSSEGVAAFARALGFAELGPASREEPPAPARPFDPQPRHQRLFEEIEAHVQTLIARADEVRDRSFLLKIMPEFADTRWSTNVRHPVHAPEKFIAGARAFRAQFRDDAIGRFDEPLLPFNARTRLVATTARWTAYDVVLDVFPELFAWGVLVLPHDLKPGERRPVVVCQHGRNGVPRDTLDANNTAYNNFAGALADRGFITFAPHNLYRGEDRYRWLDRKANQVGATLFSFILAQHDQILRWLEAQPFVDGRRIAFYGLSYGGETAVRIPALLENYCLSICSGDFNQWTRKVAATAHPATFMRTIEWEMPYWNLGHTFDYAEMAYLIFPRPFMVERGHHDRVGRDAWVAHEYAKVRWLYAQFGLVDRTEIEFFQGGHSINGQGTFEFLHRHLNWPKR